MRPALYAVLVPRGLDWGRCELLLPYVSQAKRERIERVLRPQEALRSLVAELLVRRVIGRELGIPWEAVRIAVGPQGKPVLEELAGPHFNVSHSGSWVVTAFGSRPVGVDVERIRSVPAGIIAGVLSPQERARLDAQLRAESRSADAPVRAFIEHWTLKESYLKMTGVGLAASLDRLTVQQEGERIVVQPRGACGDVYGRRYALDPAYALSLCSLDPALPERVRHVDWGEVLEPPGAVAR